MTHLTVGIANAARPTRRVRRKMLVDSGAAYSIVDGPTLDRLGIRRTGTRTFILADGTEIARDTGAALFHLHGREAASTVIFGEPGDATLIGVVTRRDLTGPEGPDRSVGSVIKRPAVVIFPDSTLRDAADQMVRTQVGRLAVVERSDHRRLVGILSRSDLIAAHARRLEHQELE